MTIENENLRIEQTIILVLENNSDLGELTRKLITDSGYQVFKAPGMKEGIGSSRELGPDLIIFDNALPDGDVYQFCEILKKNIKTAQIPIILVTAEDSEENVIKWFGAGVDDYFVKPFSAGILLARIDNLISQRTQFQLNVQKQLLLQPDDIMVSDADQEFIRELKGHIEKNMSDPGFNVEVLCELMYMERTTMFRKIKALTGEAPQYFIRSSRLEKAAKLFKNKFGTVSQVASAVGFSDFSYFSRCFKEKYNQLPSEYMVSEVENLEKELFENQ